MKSTQQLSSKRYIENQARKLPVYKCFVASGWKEAGLANVAVMRKHNNGNITMGIYAVDMMCLGIKDTFYFFNEPENLAIATLNEAGIFDEISYDLAHNIIYAGHDFAADYDIAPHKEFALTKFILKEDDETIPLIDIHTGDENGNPALIVDSSYPYGPILQKLKKYAGEGNYTFLIEDDDYQNEDVDDFNEDEFDVEDEEDYSDLDEIDVDFIDFNNVRDASDEELEEAFTDESRSISDQSIIHAEIMMRLLNEGEPGILKEYEDIVSSKDYELYESKQDLQQAAFVQNQELLETLYNEVQLLPPVDLQHENKRDSPYIKLFEKYAHNEAGGFIVLNTIPLLVITLNLEWLENTLSKYPPLVQLLIVAYLVAWKKRSIESFDFLNNVSVVENAFPGNNEIHATHHKIFWVIKALHAINSNNREELFQYHSLLSVTGIGGELKHAYALKLAEWAEKVN